MDHLPWNRDHFALLNEKLKNYVRFIESGQLLKSHPSAKERAIVISILLRYRPDGGAIEFLEKIRALLSERRLNVRFGPNPKLGYEADGKEDSGER
jgi:hypothetical protein